jgi:hypothetical protein
MITLSCQSLKVIILVRLSPLTDMLNSKKIINTKPKKENYNNIEAAEEKLKVKKQSTSNSSCDVKNYSSLHYMIPSMEFPLSFYKSFSWMDYIMSLDLLKLFIVGSHF